MRISSLTLVVVATAAGGLAPPATAATVATSGVAGGEVREYEGTIVFSEWDSGERRWYLSARTVGERQRRLAVDASTTPFHPDIGPDSAGRPQVIYQRCSGTAAERAGCDLHVLSLADDTGERPVRNANDPEHNDTRPTLWRGRIAWVREYGSGEDADPVVYTKTLTAPRSRPSTRLPGVPTRRCAPEAGLVEPPCGPTTRRSVGALELWGDNLALIVGYTFAGLPGIGQYEVRLGRISDRSAQQVAFLGSGLNAQFFAGPSFAGSRLAWYRACGVTEAACRDFVGPWRFRLSTRRYERGAPGPILVRGFADTGSRLYESVCDGVAASVEISPPAEDCPITSTAPPAFEAAAAPDLATATPPR